MIAPSILSGIVAFVLWCIADTSLKPDRARNSNGKTTFRVVLSIVLVQIVIWTTVGFFTAWVVPHLPPFFLRGWTFPMTVFASGVVQWFALLMVLQYAWLLLRATLLTALYTFDASFRERDTIRKLERILKEGDKQRRVERPL